MVQPGTIDGMVPPASNGQAVWFAVYGRVMPTRT